MSVINTNTNALYAQDSSAKVGRSLATSMQRLSTGSRINSAKDDAAGLAISTRMTSQTRGLQMAIRNANDGISLMQTTEGALDEVTSILQRMRELAVQSANGVNNGKDRSSIDAEVQQLKTEIDRIATTTKFNDQNLLDGSFKNRQLQIGHKAGETMAVDIDSVKTKDLGMAGASFDNKTLVGSRFGTITAIAAGDIMINDQAVATIAAGSNISQVVNAINQSVDNVEASAFNTVKAKSIGSGVVSVDGDLQIKVQNLNSGTAATTTYSIKASANMQQLVDNINKQAGAQVTASIDRDGKLLLSNTTGAAITVIDKTASYLASGNYDTATGFVASNASTGVTYNGFLKLDSKDGAPIRIDTGNLGKSSPGTMTQINNLGFQQVSSKFDKGLNAYQVTGKAFANATAANAAWKQTDLTINGVQIYNSAIATTSFQGKLDAINNFSNQTGVVATASFDKTISFDTTLTVSAGVQLQFNGVSVWTAGAGAGANGGLQTASDVATAINTQTSKTGITATVDGNNIRLTGANVQQLNIQAVSSSGMTPYAGPNTTMLAYASSTTVFGQISLKSVSNTPISIALGDGATQASTGFLEENVGAADFQVNAPTLGVGAGQSLSGLNVLTSASASTAIGVLDNSLDKVSALRSKLGAMENRLTHTVDNLTNIVTNTQASRSRIQDTDYATETTALAKSQIISQAATAMLAQANQQPQSVLSLLK
jgi:flagellin